ncbi:MerR family transcriptional regulator [Clostridium hydrogeniformans]|uniref:MerR family transcriptional regulator n=1 Tax=Clostridium hydrogeniformans TaxID=349933 RepID=UPI000488D5F8|nr:MerR family transcriptional regulator [Clostridium hydrogeniformans]
MNKKILIGEMAKLHNISTQTLRYYDKIDLFKPRYVDNENGYRYYDIEQFGHLDSIIFLKRLGMPLEEIEKYFSDRNLNFMKAVLKSQKERLEREIEILKEREKIIDYKLKILHIYGEENNLDTCYIKNIEKRNMIYLNFEKDRDIVEVEYGIKTLSNIINDELCLFKGMITYILDKNNINNNIYKEWKSLALVFQEKMMRFNKMKKVNEGTYATIAFKGNIEGGKSYYNKLLRFIKEKNLTICGDGLIVTISDIAFSSYEEDHIYEIQIPVNK